MIEIVQGCFYTPFFMQKKEAVLPEQPPLINAIGPNYS
jgi:hypothetical protein